VGHFIGSPGMNVLPCRVEGSTAYLDRQPVALSRAYSALAEGQRIELGIRPEFVRLQPRGAGLPVRLKRIDDIGRARIARVEMAGRPLAASVPEDLSIDGDEASLAFDSRHVHIYADGHLVTGEAHR
jgi:glycerol transport system ATP-binding protein